MADGGLRELAAEMRRSCEVRNRQQYGRLVPIAVSGSAMVSWLVSTGRAATRNAALATALKLLAAGLITPAGMSESTMRDAENALYRFQQDDLDTGGLLRSVGCAAAEDGSSRWEFAPHTAHNSLALDVALAEDLMAQGTGGEKLQLLRANVRAVLEKGAPGWVPVREEQSSFGGPALVSRRVREPRGDFYTLKSDGRVAVAPAEFQREMCDFLTRAKWEACFHEGRVLETLGEAGYPRLIYRTARLAGGAAMMFRPREICAFQDSFTHEGVYLMYEISIRHSSLLNADQGVCAEVLLLAHAARPHPDGGTELAVVTQVDAGRTSRAPAWVVSRFLHDGQCTLQVFKQQQAATTADVSLDDFDLMSVLGRGGFGTVLQVRRKQCGNYFAMKVFRKSEVRRRGQIERTMNERSIIQRAAHPYVIKLRYAFQTETKLYMVMDLAQGGDFFSFLRRRRRLEESWARFYLAEVACALEHLHSLQVIYRDLKPENVLMDARGHAVLADFGLSRDFTGVVGGNDSSKSYCGTEQYMAPEMLLQRCHTKAVDWWGLGLLAHEMIAGRHPFTVEGNKSHTATLRRMVSREPQLDGILSPQARSLVLGLLKKRTKDRLGTLRGRSELADHAFFQTVDWQGLDKRLVPAPYLPPIRNERDLAHFDSEFTDATVSKDTSSPAPEKIIRSGSNGNFFELFKLNFAKPKMQPEKQTNPKYDTAPSQAEFANFTYNGGRFVEKNDDDHTIEPADDDADDDDDDDDEDEDDGDDDDHRHSDDENKPPLAPSFPVPAPQKEENKPPLAPSFPVAAPAPQKTVTIMT